MENCPFLVTKLKVQVLPCVIAFIDGIGVDRIIGFEGLGKNPDHFTTRDLEARLIRAGVLSRKKVGEDEHKVIQRGKGIRGHANDDDDDEDWD